MHTHTIERDDMNSIHDNRVVAGFNVLMLLATKIQLIADMPETHYFITLLF